MIPSFCLLIWSCHLLRKEGIPYGKSRFQMKVGGDQTLRYLLDIQVETLNWKLDTRSGAQRSGTD